MKNLYRSFTGGMVCFLVMLCLPGYLLAVEHITFDGSPLTISAHKDIERQIVFPENTSIITGVNAEQLSLFKTLESIDNRVFIQLNELKEGVTFERQKIIFKDQVSGTNFIVFVQQSSEKSLDPEIQIHLPKNKDKTDSKLTNESSKQRINSYPFLTRYVFQQLYSPERLVKDHPLVQRVSVERVSVNNLFGCFSGSMACTALIAKPIVSYRTDRLYATAIEVSNISSSAVEVDARMIVRSTRDLLAASFMHHRLLPITSGNKSKTILVLIHKRPLREFFYEQGIGR